MLNPFAGLAKNLGKNQINRLASCKQTVAVFIRQSG